jgi:anaerobic magnesium-protoporphyrin IX monomethyl ester cyclase
MRQTISLAKELNPNIAQFSILTPFPRTPIYQRLKASGLLLTENWDRYTALEPVINYNAFGYSGKRLKYLLIEAYMRFYLRPRYLAKHRLPFSLIFKSVFKEIYHELCKNLRPEGIKDFSIFS